MSLSHFFTFFSLKLDYLWLVACAYRCFKVKYINDVDHALICLPSLAKVCRVAEHVNVEQLGNVTTPPHRIFVADSCPNVGAFLK